MYVFCIQDLDYHYFEMLSSIFHHLLSVFHRGYTIIQLSDETVCIQEDTLDGPLRLKCLAKPDLHAV